LDVSFAIAALAPPDLNRAFDGTAGKEPIPSELSAIRHFFRCLIHGDNARPWIESC
jgi:hypothetical protein